MGNIPEESDYESWRDEESIRDTIGDRLDDFARGEVPEINRLILKCLGEIPDRGPVVCDVSGRCLTWS